MPTPERKEPQLPESEASLNRAWRRLGEALGPYVFRKTNDDKIKETRDVSALLRKMLAPGIWDSYFQSELGHSGRGYANQLRDFRNGPWAHQSLEGYDDNDVLHTLYSIAQLLKAISAPEQADIVQQMHNKLIPLIAGLGNPVRQHPPSKYAEWQQEFQILETERLQLSELLMPQPSAQPEIAQLASAPTPPPPGLQHNITISVPATRAEIGATMPLGPNITNADYFVNQGNAALRQQNYGHAIECYNGALKLNPSLSAALNFPLATAYKNRGEVYFYQGENDLAIADYTMALELNPDDAEVYNKRGNAYGKEYELAFRDYEKALELNPHDAETYNNLGWTYGNRARDYAIKGEYELAFADCANALELNIDDECIQFIQRKYALTYLRRGHAYGKKEEYDLAIADYIKAQELDPHVSPNSVIVEDNTSPFSECIKDSEINPNDTEAYDNSGDTHSISEDNFIMEWHDLDITDFNDAKVRGDFHFHMGDYDLAIDDYSQVIELDRDDAEAYKGRGNAYFHMWEYDLAIDDYSQAIELDRDDAQVYKDRGNTYFRMGEYDLAIDDYSQAIELDRDDAQVYKDRGNTYFRMGEYDLAIDDYSQAIELDRDDAQVYKDRGNAYFRLGKYDLAIDDFGKALELNQEDTDAYKDLGSTYSHIGKYESAITNFKKAIELRSNDEHAYFLLGFTYGLKGEYTLAVAECTNALKLNPFHAHIYFIRGVIYAEIGEYNQAIKDFARILALEPHNPDVYRIKGEVHAMKGEHDRAIECYTKALEQNPDDAESRENLETATRLRNAATEYDQAIQENPQDPDVWHARGLHHLDDRQNYAQALADLTQALTLAPDDNHEIPYDRARAHFALGDYLAADADYTRTINLNPNDHIAWCERARAQQRLGNHRNAISDLDQALDPTRNPNYAPAYQLRSLSHAALGHRQQAQYDYEMWRTLASGS